MIPSRVLLALALMASPAIITARATNRSPGVGHTYFMRGSIVNTAARTLVVCVGPDIS